LNFDLIESEPRKDPDDNPVFYSFKYIYQTFLLLSVITICFNNLQELIATCKSVDAQTQLPAEHLLIDGSTTEEISDWLSANPQPSYRQWIHEPDKGISDAFNKGIGIAHGDIIHLLNSGDTYADNTSIERAMKAFSENPELMWLHGRYIQHRGNIDVVSGMPFDKTQLWKGMRTVAHPTMFIRREVYDRHGRYNLDYKIAMDYDLLTRIRDERFIFIDTPLVYFAPGGASDKQFHKGLAEVRRSYSAIQGSSLKQTAWQIRQRLLRAFMQTAIGKSWFRKKNTKNRHE
jgi:GT2 family glycosyltransferase